MKNTNQLKSIVKNIAKEKNISAQLVLQNYMLERFLERISNSQYNHNIIVKGGFLISSIIGIDSRTTMDMDVTIKSYPVAKNKIQAMMENISKINLNDNITFSFKNIYEIRENDEYNGYRITLTANFPPMAVPLKIDITTGDKIVPCEINYNYKLMFENRSIEILAYNLETILAEKLETIISRSDQNTRLRDFYDIYILTKLKLNEINFTTLSLALKETAEKRNTLKLLSEYKSIIEIVKNSNVMNFHWNNYCKNFNYAKNIEFSKTCSAIIFLMEKINLQSNIP